jgi:RsiW-degrading membrane proteinase PrsW (M82 family)
MLNFIPAISTETILVALLTGVVPTLIWLFFWLREDRFQPEPRGLLALTFFAGAMIVFLVLPLEQFAVRYGLEGTSKILFFAGIEEVAKFLVVYAIDFNSSYLDEPIDYAIYLITGALGFAMMENILFLTHPELQSDISFVVETGMLRFLGASILHAVLAAILGIILGFVYYKRRSIRRTFLFTGLIVVTILHTLFNSFIIKYVEIDSLLTLGLLWLLTVIIITLFEKVRAITH